MAPILYSLTLLVSAGLLMAIQPLVGRMLLPSVGGSPAVWNTCLVFFQAVLLLGYLYSHFMTRNVPANRQMILHLVVLVVAAMTVPISLQNQSPSENESPILWLLKTLFFGVGPAFFAVSTTAPLLQRWFSQTDHSSANDPYFLYAASNLGSLALLIAYPLWIEPKLRLAEQAETWRYAFYILIGLILFCGIFAGGKTHATEAVPEKSEPLTTSRILRWIGLAFLPSSLLQGVTTCITTDIASMPLLWMAPLGLYFLSFIWAFSSIIRVPLKFVSTATSISILALFFVLLIEAADPVFVVLGIHLITFFLICLLCHGVLAKDRPTPDHLTAYFLWIALGGVLGSAFNALLAPFIFQRLGLIEYPMMLILASRIRPTPETAKFDWKDVLIPTALAVAIGAIMALLKLAAIQSIIHSLHESSGLPLVSLRGALLYGLPMIYIFTLVDRPLRFMLALLVVSALSAFDAGATGNVLLRERNYLGVLKVTLDPDYPFIRLVHGRTIHGQEWLDPARINEPLTYYHPRGPAGSVMLRWRRSDVSQPIKTVGVVGLGIGSMLSYAKPNEDWILYELDPAVIQIAQNEKYFHFIKNSPANSQTFHVGDARLRLKEEPDGKFDLLILDAFSSDSIPIHLITREAVEMYLSKLAPGGMLLFHVSNRYLDLPPVLAKIGSSFDPPLEVRDNQGDSDLQKGQFPCQWVIVLRNVEDLKELRRSPWIPTRFGPSTPLWTDDFSNVIDILKPMFEKD
ncbi:fused MFS/spermidine synthase [Telmatocola sphagniphila]|uniref:Fused MFS/spermidine synthase n=1 Tax=Telmatocola sphagniphila TaxID=1123043 RepID=A0A8E6B847_9BACT|nr:fused MFS/spermidine synthase [Telmatocola sphagniphila]QVL32165.1 fused MFS/spermidine synthase [Telmatocola sphagniphila]